MFYISHSATITAAVLVFGRNGVGDAKWNLSIRIPLSSSFVSIPLLLVVQRWQNSSWQTKIILHVFVAYYVNFMNPLCRTIDETSNISKPIYFLKTVLSSYMIFLIFKKCFIIALKIFSLKTKLIVRMVTGYIFIILRFLNLIYLNLLYFFNIKNNFS